MAGAADTNIKLEVLKFMFLSGETIVSLIVLYLSWHIAIAIHEMGHFMTAVKLSALNKDSQEKAEKAFIMKQLELNNWNISKLLKF